MLRTVATGGIVPPIGPSPVVVDYSRPSRFRGRRKQGDATMLLSLPYDGGISIAMRRLGGRVVVGANLLSPISAEQMEKIKLARLTISTVASGNATIDWLAPSFRQDRCGRVTRITGSRAADDRCALVGLAIRRGGRLATFDRDCRPAPEREAEHVVSLGQ